MVTCYIVECWWIVVKDCARWWAVSQWCCFHCLYWVSPSPGDAQYPRQIIPPMNDSIYPPISTHHHHHPWSPTHHPPPSQPTTTWLPSTIHPHMIPQPQSTTHYHHHHNPPPLPSTTHPPITTIITTRHHHHYRHHPPPTIPYQRHILPYSHPSQDNCNEGRDLHKIES